MYEVPNRFWSEFGQEFEVDVAVGGVYACVAGGFDTPRFEHVFFVGEEGEVAGGFGGEACGCEGGGGAAGGVLGGVVGDGFGCVGGWGFWSTV